MAQSDTKLLTIHILLPLVEKAEHSHLTREALADVDAGQVIDHQTVQAWADSLSTNKPLSVDLLERNEQETKRIP